jgi:hypothetical protein
VIHEIIEGDERKLGFEVRVFAQMAASVAGMGEGYDENPRPRHTGVSYLFSALKLS